LAVTILQVYKKNMKKMLQVKQKKAQFAQTQKKAQLN